jgi:hypothetical protein
MSAGQTVASPPAPQQQRVRLIFGALMLVLLLASLDQTIVSRRREHPAAEPRKLRASVERRRDRVRPTAVKERQMG